MKILIIGASGFIGSHLANRLLEKGQHEVYAVSRKKIVNTSSSLHSIPCDVAESNFTSFLPTGIDCVIHLAQSDQYKNFPEGVDDIFAVNIRATQLLLEWCRKNEVKKFIYASSGNVYQRQNKLLTETDVCEPIEYYGASKYAAEQLVKQYKQFFHTCILRIFGVYGPSQKNMTIPNIIERVLNGQEVTLAKGSGLYFTPLFISDCVEMMVCTIEKENKNSLYNLAGNERIHLGQLVDLISKFVKKTPVTKLTEGEEMYLTGSATLFNEDHQYNPAITIEEGLKKILHT